MRGRSAPYPLLTACLLLVVYSLTLAPTLSWAHHGADGGDLATAVALGGVPHPPGFPTYTLLGELFVRLPWRDPVWRLNLMSAVLAAVAAGLTTAAVERLRPGRSPLVWACAGLSIGLAPLFWSQAVITEVYTAAALFAAAIVLLVVSGGPAWLLGAAWGLGIGAHGTLVFLAPLIVHGALRERGRRQAAVSALLVGPATLLGWVGAYGVMFATGRGGWSPWADLTTSSGRWALMSGGLYQGYVFGLPLSAWPRRLLAWAGLLARQFTPLGALLAGLGWLALRRERTGLAACSLASLVGLSVYTMGYDAADSLVYLVAGLPLAAIWLGLGLDEAAEWVEQRLPRGAWLLVLLPLVQLVLFWGAMDVSDDRLAVAWADAVLEKAPPRAVILTNEDAHTFALWYTHDVLGRREDAVIVDVDLWALRPYRGMVGEDLGLGEGGVAPDLSPADAAELVGRPVVEAWAAGEAGPAQ